MSGQQTTENQSIANRENAVLSVDLRDYFAAAALQGILSNTEASKTWNESDVARFCYFQSDAMIKAREVKP